MLWELSRMGLKEFHGFSELKKNSLFILRISSVNRKIYDSREIRLKNDHLGCPILRGLDKRDNLNVPIKLLSRKNFPDG